MKKYFVFSDIHAFYDCLQSSLKEAGFDENNEEHIIISCGDLLDRGENTIKCLKFVIDMYNKGRAILIRGNHEDLLDDVIKRKHLKNHDWSNGTAYTVFDLGASFFDNEFDEVKAIKYASKNKLWVEYRSHLIDYYESPKHVFVHGWVPRGEDWRNGNWSESRWNNGMEEWDNGIRVEGKDVVCGHWHTSWGHHYIDKTSLEFPNPYSTNKEHQEADFSPFIHEGIVAIDACTAYTHKVNIVVIDEENM